MAWRFKTDNLGPRPEFNLQSTPLMVKGRPYSTAGTAPRGRGARRRHRRADVGARLNEGARGASRAAAALGPRPVVLERRQGGAHPLRDARLPAGRARREDRAPGAGLRRATASSTSSRTSIRTSTWSTAPVGLHATPMIAKNVVIVGAAFETGANPKSKIERQGLRARLRRAHRQAAVDLPHHSPPGRVRQRHLAPGLVGLHRQHRRVGADVASTRSSAWPICRSSCRRTTTTAAIGPATTCSARASSPSTCRPASASGTTSWCTTACGTWTSRARRSSPTSPSTAGRSRSLAQPTKQAFLYVLRSRDRRADLADRGAAGAEGRHARRVVLADAAVPDQAAGVRRPGLRDRRSDRLHARAARGSDRAAIAPYRLGPIFTPPSVSRREGPIATLTMGAQAAATNWPGASFDPETRTLYVASQTRSPTLGLVPPPPGGPDCRITRAPCSPARGRSAAPGSATAPTARRRAVRQPHRPGPAAGEAALQPYHGDRSDHGRDPLAGAVRRDAAEHPE